MLVKSNAAEEQKIIQAAQRIYGHSAAVPCTSCHYCVDGCPNNIPIPEIFTALNKHLANGQTEEAKAEYAAVTAGKGSAADCVQCRQCEGVCPQHIPITDRLAQAAELL